MVYIQAPLHYVIMVLHWAVPLYTLPPSLGVSLWTQTIPDVRVQTKRPCQIGPSRTMTTSAQIITMLQVRPSTGLAAEVHDIASSTGASAGDSMRLYDSGPRVSDNRNRIAPLPKGRGSGVVAKSTSSSQGCSISEVLAQVGLIKSRQRQRTLVIIR